MLVAFALMCEKCKYEIPTEHRCLKWQKAASFVLKCDQKKS